MVIFHSVRLFLWGITKRCYYWAPFLFLDLFDIYEIYIKPRLPADWGGGIVLPAWWGFVLFSLMLFWAAILTYHELRTEKDALLPQLDEKQRRANIGDTLTRLIISGKELSTRVIQSDEEHQEWQQNYESWKTRTINTVLEAVSKPEAAKLLSVQVTLLDWSGKYNIEHNESLSYLTKRIDILEKMVDRYQG